MKRAPGATGETPTTTARLLAALSERPKDTAAVIAETGLTQRQVVDAQAPRTTRRPRPRTPQRGTQLVEPALPIKIRRHDGDIVVRELPAERHRRLHLGLLHADSDGYVEVAAGRRQPGGKMALVSRKDPRTFLPGGATGHARWLADLAAIAARHIADGKEVCVAPAVRTERAGVKSAVSHTNWLWIDVDGEDGLPALRRLLGRKAPHLVIETAGSGGMHAYWRLDTPLGAAVSDSDDRAAWITGKRTSVIEDAHDRLIYALGYQWQQGRPVPTVADARCKDRSRLMRLPGTVNGKTGQHARIVWADLALRAWSVDELVGDLPDPPRNQVAKRRPVAAGAHEDPYKQIPPAEYFQRLAGIEVPEHGLVSCASAMHTDTTPSCHVAIDPEDGWYCHGCEAAGAIYDLASLTLGGPTGQWLRGRQFGAARDLVRATFGER